MRVGTVRPAGRQVVEQVARLVRLVHGEAVADCLRPQIETAGYADAVRQAPVDREDETVPDPRLVAELVGDGHEPLALAEELGPDVVVAAERLTGRDATDHVVQPPARRRRDAVLVVVRGAGQQVVRHPEAARPVPVVPAADRQSGEQLALDLGQEVPGVGPVVVQDVRVEHRGGTRFRARFRASLKVAEDVVLRLQIRELPVVGVADGAALAVRREVRRVAVHDPVLVRIDPQPVGRRNGRVERVELARQAASRQLVEAPHRHLHRRPPVAGQVVAHAAARVDVGPVRHAPELRDGPRADRGPGPQLGGGEPHRDVVGSYAAGQGQVPDGPRVLDVQAQLGVHPLLLEVRLRVVDESQRIAGQQRPRQRVLVGGGPLLVVERLLQRHADPEVVRAGDVRHPEVLHAPAGPRTRRDVQDRCTPAVAGGEVTDVPVLTVDNAGGREVDPVRRLPAAARLEQKPRGDGRGPGALHNAVGPHVPPVLVLDGVLAGVARRAAAVLLDVEEAGEPVPLGRLPGEADGVRPVPVEVVGRTAGVALVEDGPGVVEAGRAGPAPQAERVLDLVGAAHPHVGERRSRHPELVVPLQGVEEAARRLDAAAPARDGTVVPRLVRHDRAAHGAGCAPDVDHLRRLDAELPQLGRQVFRLHAAAGVLRVDRRGEGVAPLARDRVDRGAARTVLGAHAGDLDLHLPDGVGVGDVAGAGRRADVVLVPEAVERRPGARLAVIEAVGALRRPGVAGAAHVRPVLGEPGSHLGDRLQPVVAHRQDFELLGVEHRLLADGLHVDHRRLAGDGDRLLDRADRHLGVDRRREPGADGDSVADDRGEAGQRERDRVVPERELHHAVQPGAVGERHLRRAERGGGHIHGDARQDTSGVVGHLPGDAAELLRGRTARTQKNRAERGGSADAEAESLPERVRHEHLAIERNESPWICV